MNYPVSGISGIPKWTNKNFPNFAAVYQKGFQGQIIPKTGLLFDDPILPHNPLTSEKLFP